MEAKRNFWSFSGSFTYRHHVQEPQKLHLPCTGDQKRHWSCCRKVRWMILGTFIVIGNDQGHGPVSFGLLKNKFHVKDTCGRGERLTKFQATSSPEYIWPEVLVKHVEVNSAQRRNSIGQRKNQSSTTRASWQKFLKSTRKTWNSRKPWQVRERWFLTWLQANTRLSSRHKKAKQFILQRSWTCATSKTLNWTKFQTAVLCLCCVSPSRDLLRHTWQPPKVLDVVSRHSGCAGQTRDTLQCHRDHGNSSVQPSGFVNRSRRLEPWDKIQDPVAPSERIVYGHHWQYCCGGDNLRRSWLKMAGYKFQIGNVYSCTKGRAYFSPFMWTTHGSRGTNTSVGSSIFWRVRSVNPSHTWTSCTRTQTF